jgi:uncharacterized protein
MKKIRLKFYILTILICVFSASSLYSQGIPEKPNPPRLVNDYARLLTGDEVSKLERRLELFNDSSTTQIVIVIVKDLGGYDKADFAQRLGEKWGVGQKGKNNGVVILVKPKTAESRGDVHIAPGYGLEGVIPDLAALDIVNKEMIPAFRKNEYYTGLDKALNVLMALSRKEFTPADYMKKKGGSSGKSSGFPIVIIIVIVIVISTISKGSGGSNNRNIGTGGLPFWLLLGGLNSGRHSGSWGGFSGGGSSGGFGGFGGGSFGGGGAGGSW